MCWNAILMVIPTGTHTGYSLMTSISADMFLWQEYPFPAETEKRRAVLNVVLNVSFCLGSREQKKQRRQVKQQL